jgi:hypothetical protein
MSAHHALVFEGDRINAESLEFRHVHPDPLAAKRWFTIGCAETALAKLQLNGMTQAAEVHGFESSTFQRQAFLRMIMADYCGRGGSFTVPGQRLWWRDRAGTMQFPAADEVELEARWDHTGAVCLDTPRLEANPTPGSESMLETLRTRIRLACGGQAPPSCGPYYNVNNLQSYNPL